MKRITLDGGGVAVLPLPEYYERSLRAAQARPSGIINPSGDPELREGFLRCWKDAANCEIPEDAVMVTQHGSHVALQVAMDWACRFQPTVASFSPLWFGFPSMIHRIGLKLKIGTTRAVSGYLPSVGLIEQVARETDVGCLLVNQFGTPTGAMLDETILLEIADVVRRTPGLRIVEDAVFWKNGPEGRKFPTLLSVAPDLWRAGRLIGVASLTKAWGVGEAGGKAGMSVGFMWGPPEFKSWAIQQTFSASTDWSADPDIQFALRHAFEPDGLAHMSATVKAIRGNLTHIDWLCRRSGFDMLLRPDGGNNVLLGVSNFIGLEAGGKEIKTSADVVALLASEWNVVTMDGKSFEADQPSIRVNLAGAPDGDFADACSRMRSFWDQLR